MTSRLFCVIAAAVLTVGLLLSIRHASGQPSPLAIASADVQRSEFTSPRYSSKPIRDIQPIADRVLADNPETPGQAPSDFGEFDRESWRIVRLEVPKPDHEWMRVTLARPLAWLETARRDDQGRLWLEFKELGIANWANVVAIERCPEAAVGDGRLVTGKFEHSSAEVIDLYVDGVTEPIGTTSNHPFWSEDRQDFVQAGKLRIGEHLRLRDCSTPVVTATVPRSQSMPVFNLEVDGEHVYYVAANGVLVHNSDDYHGGRYEDLRTENEDGEPLQRHHMPSNASSLFETEDAPAIEMVPEDHRMTESYGGGIGSSRWEYREQQRQLIEAGLFDDAMQMDIDDVTTKFPGKYDDAILEAIEAIPDKP